MQNSGNKLNHKFSNGQNMRKKLVFFFDETWFTLSKNAKSKNNK